MAAAAGAVTLLTVGAGTALADGSRTLYPTDTTCTTNAAGGSCRANIEWRANAYGPSGSAILRRTLLSVYARAGEVILTGSSAVGVGAGDISVYDPGVVTDRNAVALPTLVPGSNGFRCSVQRTASGVAAQGRITSRAQELAGPQAVTGGGNPTGYVPCSYTAPVTGIYDVAMFGPAGDGSTADGAVSADTTLTAAVDFSAAQGTSVAAWDLTVRASDTSTTDLTGRVFTYALAAFTAANGLPLNMRVYVTTTDGFRYQTDTRGLDPNGFLMYGNSSGFLDADGVTPLDHDVLGTAGGGQLTGVAGGVSFAPPQYPLSFTPLAPETLAALGIPLTPTAPVMSGFSFAGNIAGNFSTVGGGGTFTYTENVPAQYEFVISRDGSNFDPDDPQNRVLRGNRPAGTNTVTWDGKDNTGHDFPVGTDYPVRARLHNGEYHFPMIDAENSTEGGPTFTLLNPPGGACPFGNSACTTAFYDDRGYHTAGVSGADVGTPGTALCGVGAPATDHSDVENGYDSAGTQRAYGQNTGGNTNVSCTGSFGDVKGLDTWVFYPSTTLLAPLNIVASSGAPPTAAPDAGTTPVDTPLRVPAPGVLGNDTGTAITVTGHTPPSHGTVTIAADGSYVYTPSPGWTGRDTFTYTITDAYGRTATTTVTVTVTPVAAPDSATTPEGEPVTLHPVTNDTGTGLHVTSVTQPPAGTGTVQIVGGDVVYTPPPGYVGTTSWTYTVTDAAGQTTTATDTVTVLPGPTARDDHGSGHAGQTVTVQVLNNDTPTAGARFDTATLRLRDPHTGTAVTRVSLPGKGTLRVGTGGVVTFTPAPGYHGTTPAVAYTVTDSRGRTTGAHMTITIGPGPVARPDHGSGPSGRTVTVPVQRNDTASAGGARLVAGSVLLVDPVSGARVRSVTVPDEGTFAAHADGAVSFTPNAGWSGTTRPLGYIELDSFHQRASSWLTVTIAPAPGSALPRTGDDVAGLATAGAGLVLTGAALLLARRRSAVRSHR